MSPKFLWSAAAVAALLTMIGLAGADRILAEWIHPSSLVHAPVFVHGNTWLDILTLKTITHGYLGLVLLLAGLTWWRIRPASADAKLLALAGASSFATTFSIGLLKNVFGRLRPDAIFESGDWTQTWLAGGSSFPSGHSGFYFGLALPLAAAYPRTRWLLLPIAAFIALARLDQDLHFLSDVTASVVIAAAFALAAGTLLNRWAAMPATSTNTESRTGASACPSGT
ncbi:MAG TPA: phosphatase PAP2 family protein [Dongiaceae bacterium]|jgi:membrane-associated phospholipid phosphatase|nr:phosphatase PAP2 family protein [Dongiaceae bacterium]